MLAPAPLTATARLDGVQGASDLEPATAAGVQVDQVVTEPLQVLDLDRSSSAASLRKPCSQQEQLFPAMLMTRRCLHPDLCSGASGSGLMDSIVSAGLKFP